MKQKITSEDKSCRECGKPLPDGAKWNTLYCVKCKREHRLETYRKSRKKRYKKHKDAYLKEKREEYQWYKQHGICVCCHANDALVQDGKRYTRCAECREKTKKGLTRCSTSDQTNRVDQ